MAQLHLERLMRRRKYLDALIERKNQEDCQYAFREVQALNWAIDLLSERYNISKEYLETKTKIR